MPMLADLIYEKTKTLAESAAHEDLDFIGDLKHKSSTTKPYEAAADITGTDVDWAEFERLAGAWSGKLNRDECYDRPLGVGHHSAHWRSRL